MVDIRGCQCVCGLRRAAPRAARFAPYFLLATALALAGCHSPALTDTRPLDNAGLSYDAIQQLRALEITDAEVAQISQAKQGGLSDDGCVEMEKIYRGRGQHFDAGGAVAGLLGAGMGEDNVLAIARLGQLAFGAGELQAMRLAGLSDPIILEVARHRAESKPVLSGASLAMMKNTAMHESTLLKLTQLSVPDSEAAAILSSRHHGASDAEILRHFEGP